MPETHLAVGDPTRERAGRVVLVSLALATVFLAVTWWSKETPALVLHQPWQDDPYDVVVSTSLTGTVADQAALHGLLARVRDLGLDLISLRQVTG